MNKRILVNEFLALMGRKDKLELRLRATAAMLRKYQEYYFKSDCTGCGDTSDGEGGHQWATYPATMTDEQIKEDWTVKLQRYWHRDYSGPGLCFCHEPYIKRNKHRVLVRQYHGLDI